MSRCSPTYDSRSSGTGLAVPAWRRRRQPDLQHDPECEGNFTAEGIPSGTYDVRVKGKHSLSTKRTNVAVPTVAPTDFCTVLEGDASDDDRVSGVDFSILATTYNKQTGQPGFDARADFNDDGRCSGVDFSLLATNYNRSGPVACASVAASGTPAESGCGDGGW